MCFCSLNIDKVLLYNKTKKKNSIFYDLGPSTKIQSGLGGYRNYDCNNIKIIINFQSLCWFVFTMQLKLHSQDTWNFLPHTSFSMRMDFLEIQGLKDSLYIYHNRNLR